MIYTDGEMLDAITEGVLTDAIEDIVMHDILMEIIQKNEVSKLADQHVEKDKIANSIAEEVFRETVMTMLHRDIIEPSLTVAAHEKHQLSEALVGKDMGQFGKLIDSMTARVVQESVDQLLA